MVVELLQLLLVVDNGGGIVAVIVSSYADVGIGLNVYMIHLTFRIAWKPCIEHV